MLLLVTLLLLRGRKRHTVAWRGTEARRRLRGARLGKGHGRRRAMSTTAPRRRRTATSDTRARHVACIAERARQSLCRSCHGETLCDACMRCSQSLCGRSLRRCDVGAYPSAAAPPTSAASRRQAAFRSHRARGCTAAARKRAQGDARTAGEAGSDERPPPQSVPAADDGLGPKDFWEGEQWESLGTAASYGIAVVALLGGALCLTPCLWPVSHALCVCCFASHCGRGGHVHLQRRRRRGGLPGGAQPTGGCRAGAGSLC